MLNIQYHIQFMINHNMVHKVTVGSGANLAAICREHQIPIETACNGKGICGKCRVRIVQGYVPVTEEDRSFFSAQELADGYRLACKIKIADDLVIAVQGDRMDIQTLGLQQTKALYGGKEKKNGSRMEYAIAVDLGSTTLAAALINEQGAVIAQSSAVNSQRAYGADVISRIQASVEGKRRQLQACICKDLEGLFRTLRNGQEEPVKISRIAIAGNTTMLHLLRGYSCETLGREPFEPVNLEMECLSYRELFTEVPGCSDSQVYLLPGISAFIGADITAGLYSSGFWQAQKECPAFFIDLGTNGELAFGSSDGFVTASTAAGPAFEGGRLRYGVPGIPGAIFKVSYLYHRVRVQTIGQKKPCGICGTGAMEAVAALRQEGLMDENGLLDPKLFDEGMLLAKREDGSDICLTQADVREIQMAKAAIRAGLEVLQKRYEEDHKKDRQIQAERVYLAGGFGYYLSADTAVSIGLFPKEWKQKIVPCANTSLKGAIAFLTEPSCAHELEKIRSKNRSIRLESDPDFQDRYVQAMRFPPI